MTMYGSPATSQEEAAIPIEIRILTKLEATPNAIRLRIAGLAPDQLERGTSEDLSIAEQIALLALREQVYGSAFVRVASETLPKFVEPEAPPMLLDRDFGRDLATFFDLRRTTLDTLRAMNDAQWNTQITVVQYGDVSVRDLAYRLMQFDEQLLHSLSGQRAHWNRTNGVDELRDYGVAGKLGSNLGQ